MMIMVMGMVSAEAIQWQQSKSASEASEEAKEQVGPP